MSVLKGASAAAIYGSRAGNGVILITTKSGKKNDGLGINVNFGVTADTPFMLPELQSSFGQGSVGAYNDQTNLSWGPRIEGQTITTYDGRQVPMAAYDNIGAFFGTGTSFITRIVVLTVLSYPIRVLLWTITFIIPNHFPLIIHTVLKIKNIQRARQIING